MTGTQAMPSGYPSLPYTEMDRCEASYAGYNIYSEEYREWEFIKAFLKEATERYPMTMHRAKTNYFKENP